MLNQRIYSAAVLLVTLALLTVACARPTPPLTPVLNGTISVYVTDALPKEVSAVVVKASNIEVHQVDAAEDKWISILKDPPIFDLVKIAGVNVLLGSSDVAPGKYTQVRLDITEVNATIDGKQVKATVPSDKLRLVGEVIIEEGKKTPITLDFDGEKSVVLEGKDKAHLKPVVRLIVGKPGSTPEATSTPATASTGKLENTTWVLQSYGQPGNLKSVLKDTEVSVLFDSAKGQVAGSAGVNSYFGGYEVKGSKLSIPGPVGSTKMAGPQPVMDQETEFLKLLQAADSYQIKDGQLQIDCGQQILIFKLK